MTTPPTSLENRTLQMFPYLPTTKSTGICIYTLWLLSCHWSNRMLHGPFLAVYNSKTKTKSNVIGAKYSSILKWSTSLQCKATPNIAPHDPHLLVLNTLAVPFTAASVLVSWTKPGARSWGHGTLWRGPHGEKPIGSPILPAMWSSSWTFQTFRDWTPANMELKPYKTP